MVFPLDLGRESRDLRTADNGAAPSPPLLENAMSPRYVGKPIRQLREGEALGRFARKLQTCIEPAVLVLDEVGYLPLSLAEVNMLFQFVTRHYFSARSCGAAPITAVRASFGSVPDTTPRWQCGCGH
jgi:hypothetical protein